MKAGAVTVVGGAYGEECCFPQRTAYRGSGGRAAAVLSSLGSTVSLVTTAGPLLKPIFEEIASSLGYTIQARIGFQDIWFRYRHPLSHPTIYPYAESWAQTTDKDVVHADNALVFGMIEGRPPVMAKRAVYDPQDGIRAKDFFENGSLADDLALVVSHSEGKALTGEGDPIAIAGKLLATPSASAVIVKCGAQGAFVKADRIESWVRPFPTRRVYKIGSGDAFSAAFAYAWLTLAQDALSAAWFASRLTAAYVESGIDRIDRELVPGYLEDAERMSKRFAGVEPRAIPETHIYLAGPFFSSSQRWEVDEARDSLCGMGFKVFSPVHDVGIGPPEDVCHRDLFGLEESGLVLALLTGLDAGTLFEVGYARAKGIPVIAVAESVDSCALTMVIGSGCTVVDDLTTGIYSACWHLMGDV